MVVDGLAVGEQTRTNDTCVTNIYDIAIGRNKRNAETNQKDGSE